MNVADKPLFWLPDQLRIRADISTDDWLGYYEPSSGNFVIYSNQPEWFTACNEKDPGKINSTWYCESPRYSEFESYEESCLLRFDPIEMEYVESCRGVQNAASADILIEVPTNYLLGILTFIIFCILTLQMTHFFVFPWIKSFFFKKK